ncbi:hypothetical protein [Nocardia sp. NRRL S-836]|uniref:hypothetical protein n=1 Tax=Nocardia sp. NRRL S-836 TaxID=1519492 RepID=UPI000A93F35C|nr:hypothetical protein [Nocardia sp. NRRL S-836]
METTRRRRKPALNRAPRWTLLAVAFASVAAGLALPHALLIAAGLLLAGCVALP